MTGDHEITFTATTGTVTCFDVRAETTEDNGVLHVALVEGGVPGAPEACTMEAREVKVPVKTAAKASTLKVQAMPVTKVSLNKLNK